MLGFNHRSLTNTNEKGKRTRATKVEVALRVMQTVALTFLLVNGCPCRSIYRRRSNVLLQYFKCL
jgi:hypothetical protein